MDVLAGHFVPHIGTEYTGMLAQAELDSYSKMEQLFGSHQSYATANHTAYIIKL